MFRDVDIAEMLRLLKKIDDDIIALQPPKLIPVIVKVPKRRGRPLRAKTHHAVKISQVKAKDEGMV